MMIRQLLLLCLLILAFAASKATAAPIVYSISPNPSVLHYGDNVGWNIVGDSGGGWVTLSCSQSGVNKVFNRQWWFPYYHYYATMPLTVNQPFQTNNGTGLSCNAKFEDVVGMKSGGICNYWNYPPLYSCTRLKFRNAVNFSVLP